MLKLFGCFIFGLCEKYAVVVCFVINNVDYVLILMTIFGRNGSFEVATDDSTNPVNRGISADVFLGLRVSSLLAFIAYEAGRLVGTGQNNSLFSFVGKSFDGIIVEMAHVH